MVIILGIKQFGAERGIKMFTTKETSFRGGSSVLIKLLTTFNTTSILMTQIYPSDYFEHQLLVVNT